MDETDLNPVGREPDGETWLADERNMLRALLDNSPDYVFFKDRRSCFVRTNEAHAQKLLGLASADAAVGLTDFDLFGAKEAQRFYDEEQQIMASGRAIIAREWPLTSSTTGETAWVSEHKIPIANDSGEVIGLLGIARDITRLKRIEAEREELLAALERRTAQLQAATEVSTAVSSILDPDELVQKVVEVMRERFGLYYVGLFLVDQTATIHNAPGEWAYLRAATGEVGQNMLKQRYRLQIGSNSMVGRCIADGQPRIALDTDREAVRLANPLLPDTRSELALPLVSRGEAIGALTIQSRDRSAFSDQDVAILQAMAGQVTNAIENARLFKDIQEALEELQAVQKRYVREAWGRYLGKKPS